MKFAALLKKELRICLPWLLLGAVAFVVIGAIIMKIAMLNQEYYIDRGYRDGYYWYTPYSAIREFAPLILITSLSLGIILGVVQFFLPGLFRTWAFTIHRSVTPRTIIVSKFTAALLTFLVSLGLLWTLFYSYVAVPGRFYMPILFRTYLEGWVYILAGLIAYFGTSLSAVSTAHIYTTRILGIVVGATVIIIVLVQTSITAAIIWSAVGACVLIIQIFDAFLSREF